MLTYLIRRLLLFVPTLIGATALIFFVMFLAPISIVDTLLPPGGELQPGQRALREAYLDERYGLSKPPWEQYFRWLNRISPVGFETWTAKDAPVLEAKAREKSLRDVERVKLAASGMAARDIETAVKKIDITPDIGDIRLNKPALLSVNKEIDLGSSFIKSRPVAPIIAEALPITIILQVVSLPIAVGLSLVTGIWSAQHRGKVQDVATGFILLALYSIPAIWVGVLFIGFLANAAHPTLQFFPTGELNGDRVREMSFFPSASGSGYLLDTAWHLILPVICVSYGTVAFYSKLTRTALLETLGSDFVRSARAKGLSEKVVLYRHALRNSLVPLITVAASFLPRLVTGSVVVEFIFNLNGMGRLSIEALKANDRELFLSTSVIILLLQLGGFLLADIAYAIADPRVSYE